MSGNDIHSAPEPDEEQTLPAPVASWSRAGAGEGRRDLPHAGRLWHDELRRWLATLNPGRTAHEYEKAVGYFFQTPGVPQNVADVSFDLLLAYRGALALRATPHTDGAPARGLRVGRRAALGAHQEPPALDGERGDISGATRDAFTAGRYATQGSPLAPATVNLRLTALRQFLVHCALMGLLPELTPDRVRAALRRLKVERRRPYQILDESEWHGFLDAARTTRRTTSFDRSASDQESRARDAGRPAGPWGIPRALRATHQADVVSTSGQPPQAAAESARIQSRSGLTGARTGERDFALIALALATGLRSIELAALDVGDVVHERRDGRNEWWLILPDVKTKGQHGGRTLPLAADLGATLAAYVQTTGRRWERAEDRRSPLFLSGKRGQQRLSLRHIRRIVDRVETQWLVRRAAADEESRGEGRLLSPHALRHSTAIALLQGNESQGRPPASVEHVRGWLGHFDIRTTQRYLAHLESREHRRPYALSLGGTGATTAEEEEGERPGAGTQEEELLK